jgi:triacylglycerol lipase
MGGLVVRAACHQAALGDHPWLKLVQRTIYVGTPHLGSPLERVGRVVARLLRTVDDPYTRLAADLAGMRSEGIQDLGDGDVRHEDRARRLPRLSLRDPRHPVPLLPSIRHHLIAGALWPDARLAALFGDGIVPLSSATDAPPPLADSPLTAAQIKIVGKLSHLELPRSPEVYEQIRAWCAEGSI